MPATVWQKSSYCAQGEACVHVSAAPASQKSSRCQEGEACVHISADTPETIRLTESADPARTVLTTGPAAFTALLTSLRQPSGPLVREL